MWYSSSHHVPNCRHRVWLATDGYKVLVVHSDLRCFVGKSSLVVWRRFSNLCLFRLYLEQCGWVSSIFWSVEEKKSRVFPQAIVPGGCLPVVFRSGKWLLGYDITYPPRLQRPQWFQMSSRPILFPQMVYIVGAHTILHQSHFVIDLQRPATSRSYIRGKTNRYRLVYPTECKWFSWWFLLWAGGCREILITICSQILKRPVACGSFLHSSQRIL